MTLALPNGWIRTSSATASDDEIRDFVVAIEKTFAGLSADPKTRAAYDAIVAPTKIEGSVLQASMNEMWSCALTQDGAARFFLEDAAPEVKAKILFLWQSYKNGRAMLDEESAASVLSAMHMRAAIVGGKVKLRRAMIHIIDAESGTTAHTYMQTSELDAAGRFTTIEGGEVDANGFKAIKAGERLARGNGIVTSIDGKTIHVLYAVIDMVEEIRASGASIGIPAPPPAVTLPSLPAVVVPAPTAPVAVPSVRVSEKNPAAVYLTLLASSVFGFISKHPMGVAFGLLVAIVLGYEIVLLVRSRHVHDGAPYTRAHGRRKRR
jgi:hypothetical protein